MNEETRLELDLRDLLAGRATVDEADIDALRRHVATLPERARRGRRALLGAAAGIVMLLGLGALVLTQLPYGSSGAAPGPPDPRAFGGDPRLDVCGVTVDGAVAVFEMAHVRDYPLHLPAAYPLIGLQADPEAPALVIVLAGPATPERGGETTGPAHHDLCMVVGPESAGWEPIGIVNVDTTGLQAYLPEPSGSPIADELAPWVARCGGPEAGILEIHRFPSSMLGAVTLDPSPPELAGARPAVVIVYAAGHPFPPLGTPPPGAATVEPREPLAPGRHDLCVLVGDDPDTAVLTIHEDVAVSTMIVEPVVPTPTPSPERSSSSVITPLPPQIDPADCELMNYAEDRCLAVVEEARSRASLDWADIVGVRIREPEPDDVARTTSRIATVTFTLSDGSGAVDQDVLCGLAGRFSLVCTDNPEIPIYSSGGSAYRDVPCGPGPAGEPGSTCATPLPLIDPSAAAQAVPLLIEARDIPLTGTGRLEIHLGTASLPNGILTDAYFTLADIHTRAFTVSEGMGLEIRSLDPTRPRFDNYYLHGWYPGVEEVEVYLVLDVTSVTPGAILELRDVVVR